MSRTNKRALPCLPLPLTTRWLGIIDAAAGATAGNFGAIQFLKDATISAVAGESIGNIAKLQTSFSAGTVIYGKFTSVTLSAGLVALHKI